MEDYINEFNKGKARKKPTLNIDIDEHLEKYGAKATSKVEYSYAS
jgi:hypothetical protein